MPPNCKNNNPEHSACIPHSGITIHPLLTVFMYLKSWVSCDGGFMSFSFFKQVSPALVGLALVFHVAPASAVGLGTTPFNWQSDTGSWQYAWGTLPNDRIPAADHSVKTSIATSIKQCGIGRPNPSLEKTYAIDFTGDGRSDYILDATGYFIRGYNPSCSVRICDDVNGDGTQACMLGLYVTTQPTRMTPPPSGVPECSITPPTLDQCPGYFEYNFPVAMSIYAFDWNFYAANSAKIASILAIPNGNGKNMYTIYNGNPVFEVITSNSACTNEEMQTWNNKCEKFYQYAKGQFYDLYSPQPYAYTPDSTTSSRMVATTPYGDTDPLHPNYSDCPPPTDKDYPNPFDNITINGVHYDNSGCSNVLIGPAWTNDDNTTGNLKLKRAVSSQSGFMAFQYTPSPSAATPTPTPTCYQLTNTSSNDYFTPSHTSPTDEVADFINTVNAGKVAGVSQLPSCQTRFTPWLGQTKCPPLPCGETLIITAERWCQRSTSAYAGCNECSGDVDNDPNDPVNYPKNQCTFTKQCYGGRCPVHISCLPAETLIQMADGSRKAIVDVKVGDLVLGFDKNAPLDAPHPAKVAALMQTEDMDTLKINDLKITGGHLLMTQNGKLIPANSVKVGDKLVGISGEIVSVKTIDPAKEKTKVYNLGLENADGYIADGIRVVIYPTSGK
jgi:hypothetical protein